MGATAFAYPPSERFDFVVDKPFDITTNLSVFDTSQKLARQPEWNAEFYKLWAGNTSHFEFPSEMIDVGRVAQIVSLNAFQAEHYRCIHHTGIGPSLGCYFPSRIWLRPSFLNHSCVPNCNRTFFANVILVYLTREIHEGEELTVSYSPQVPFHERKEVFKSHFRFVCDCPLCCEESQDPLMQERLALTELFENPELLKHPEKAEMELARLKPIIQQLEKVIKERNIEWLFEDLIV